MHMEEQRVIECVDLYLIVALTCDVYRLIQRDKECVYRRPIRPGLLIDRARYRDQLTGLIRTATGRGEKDK
jgi:hypothetical protein